MLINSSPIGWWKLDQTSSQIATDSAGRKDGIYQNGPTPVTGKVDDGLYFDGVNDYVTIANNSSLGFGAGDFSISTWVKTSDQSGVDVLLDKRVETSGPVLGYSLYNYNGKISLQIANGSGWSNYDSNTLVANGQWHHVTVTVDRDNSTGGKFYVDGNLVNTFNPTGRQGNLDNSKNLTMGQRSDNPGWLGSFNGSLDEVKFFNRSLSPLEVTTMYNVDANPTYPNRIAWWKLDETSGLIAADSAGKKDGIYQNGPTPVTGKVDDGLYFDGVNDYVTVANNSSLGFGAGDFSISTWVKTSDQSGVDVLLDKRVETSGPVLGYSLYNYNGKISLQIANGSGWSNYDSNTLVANGQWHHVAVAVDRDNLTGGKFYVDGNLVNTFNPTGRQGNLDNQKALTMGQRSDNPGWLGSFNGSLDEVMLFNSALSDTQIQNIYQSQNFGLSNTQIQNIDQLQNSILSDTQIQNIYQPQNSISVI